MSISIFEPPPVPANDAERERAVIQSGALDAHADSVLAAICAKTRQQFDAAASLISVLYGETQYVIAADGFVVGPYRRRHSLSGYVIAAGRDVFFIPDLLADARFSENPWVNSQAQSFRFYLASMVRLDLNHPIGVISVLGEQARPAISPAERTAMLDARKAVAERLKRFQAAAVQPRLQ